MNVNSGLLLLMTSFLTNSSIAGTMGSVQQPDWTWVTTISAGPVWESEGNTQTFYLVPEVEKTYVANDSSHVLANGEFFLGLQRILSPKIQSQLGLAVGATTSARPSGIIWDDADPVFNNYSYSYSIQHTHIAAKGKLLADMGYWLTPWASASLGVGFNRAHHFTNTPLIFEAVPNSNFTNHTTTAFTYTLGVGVQKSITNHWQVGVGYEFADWGKSNLGHAPDQTLNSGLVLNHLYTNGVLLNLTYLA